MLYLYNLHTSIARNKKSTCTLFVCAFVEKKAVFFFSISNDKFKSTGAQLE